MRISSIRLGTKAAEFIATIARMRLMVASRTEQTKIERRLRSAKTQ
jgi:hypothetical protein